MASRRKTARVICIVLAELAVFGGLAGAFVSWGSGREMDLYSGRYRDFRHISFIHYNVVDVPSDYSQAYEKLVGDFPKQENWVVLWPSTYACYGFVHIHEGSFHFELPAIITIGELCNSSATHKVRHQLLRDARLTDAAKKKLLLGALQIMREPHSSPEIREFFAALVQGLIANNLVGDVSTIPNASDFIHQQQVKQ